MPCMKRMLPSARSLAPLWLCAALAGLQACAPLSPADSYSAAAPATQQSYQWLNRVTWGANSHTARQLEQQGQAAWLQQQLQPRDAVLPEPARNAVRSMTISQTDLTDLVLKMEQQRKSSDALKDDAEKKAAQQAYQQELNRLARESATRHLLRALYSPAQVQEQMTWFWLNHFNVQLYKHNLRAMLGDYEDNALRPHALGRFRDLLGAVTYHPAMLRYLDNDQNAAGRINENFARELMELHTLGVDGGYTQKDVQELARVLTGVGVNMNTGNPNLRKELNRLYVRRGVFEFNPQRHDMGPKTLLGSPVTGEGLAEVDAALDTLARHPSTARFVSRKLATYWLSDNPPQALIDRMAATWKTTDGQIAKVLETLFTAPEFVNAPPTKFKDPVRYVVSSVRLAYDDKVILNVGPMLNWINRMGEPLYGRQTPDGYPLVASGWDSAGQLTTRFEIAKAIGSGSAGLFKTDGPQATEKPAFPQLANALYYQAIQGSLSPATRAALDQANSPQEWNTFLLAAPESMRR
ncbi:hypothetical protein os4_32850 [Comamonadaceae bacterium OS-4]|nr:hypothetical protein os4_32850 [Comamonadaceae bacterium OS-4]